MKDYSELLATLLRTLSDLPGTDDDLFAEIDDQRRRAATAIRELIAENDQMIGIAAAWKALYKAAERERDEAKEELDTWRSVFPDVAPDSVQPDRSLLEKRLAEYEKALEWYASDETWTKDQVLGPYGDYGKYARAALALRNNICS